MTAAQDFNELTTYSRDWLRDQLKKGTIFTYFGFWGTANESELEKSFSNFHKTPIKQVLSDGTTHVFNCSEQLFMYQKAIFFNDQEMAQKILTPNMSPNAYKNMGRKIRNFDEAAWSENSYQVMFNTLYSKFSQNPALKQRLLSTGKSIIVEASPYDKIWGIGLGKFLHDGKPDKTQAWKNVNKWNGENLLGFALMEVRDILE